MLQNIKKEYRHIIVGGLIVLIVLVGLTAKVAYYLGERHVSELVLHTATIPDGKLDSYSPDYSKTIDRLRYENNRLSNDYDSACYRYQELYAAYDALYAQFGTSSGQEKIVRPDSARSNPESCYR